MKRKMKTKTETETTKITAEMGTEKSS